MNTGELAFFTNKNLQVPSHLIKPFHLGNNSIITGLYFPPTRKHDKAGIITGNRDFIFSPIPFRLWPKLINIQVKLKEESGTLAKLTEYLRDLSINIIQINCYRATYSFYIANIIGEFENLEDEMNNEENRIFSEITSKTNHSIKEEEINRVREGINLIIEKKCKLIRDDIIRNENQSKDFIFKSILASSIVSSDDFELKENINIKRMLALSYHFWETKLEEYFEDEQDRSNPRNETIHAKRWFEAKVFNNSIIFPDSLSKKIYDKAEIDLSNIHYGYVQLMEQSYYLRISMIPKKDIGKFRKIVIPFAQTSETIRKSGFLNDITKVISQNYKIHDIVNHTYVNRLKIQKVRIDIIVEDDRNDIDEINNVLDVKFTEIYKDNLEVDISELKDYLLQKNFQKDEIEIFIELLTNKYLNGNKTKLLRKPKKYFFSKDYFVKDVKQLFFISRDSILKSQIKSITHLKDKSGGKNPDYYRVQPISYFRIFISLNSNSFFESNIIKICKDVGKQFGLSSEDFITVHSDPNPTTQAVIDGIKRCNGVIQFYMEFGEKRDDFKRWLDAEYLSAKALEKPIVRLIGRKVDIPTTDKDIYSEFISGDMPKSQIKKIVKSAMHKLVSEMREKYLY
jgi:hypothetical protein